MYHIILFDIYGYLIYNFCFSQQASMFSWIIDVSETQIISLKLPKVHIFNLKSYSIDDKEYALSEKLSIKQVRGVSEI